MIKVFGRIEWFKKLDFSINSFLSSRLPSKDTTQYESLKFFLLFIHFDVFLKPLLKNFIKLYVFVFFINVCDKRSNNITGVLSVLL